MIKPNSRAEKRERAAAEIKRLGLSCDKRGLVYRVHGLDVDVMCVDLADLVESDLRPPAAYSVE